MEHSNVAKDVMQLEAHALIHVASKMDGNFDSAVDAILKSPGRTIVCGMGKSGIIARKIAATLASTGTPSFFMHPGEAFHGDLGMVTSEDIFIAISNSGETEEVVKLIPFLFENGNTLISMTGNPNSTLASSAHLHIDIGVDKEACPLQLAPTSSTTATLATGDALAVALMKARDFKPENFARFHPGGSLGRRLLCTVEQEMHKENLPFLSAKSLMPEIISTMTTGGLGIAIVINENGPRIITDGDIRRAIETFKTEFLNVEALQISSGSPVSVSPETRVEDAIAIMEKNKITSLLVTDPSEEDAVVGVFKK